MKTALSGGIGVAWVGAVLSMAGVSGSEIKLAWNDNSANETGFYIERSEIGSSFERIATVGANVSEFTDSNVLPEKEYRYRVSAGNDRGDSPNSNVITAVAPVQRDRAPKISQITD